MGGGKGAVVVALWLTTTLMPLGARAEPLAYAFELPAGHAVMTKSDVHTVVSPDGLTSVLVRAISVTSPAEVDAVLSGLPRAPSEKAEMYLASAAARQKDGTWTGPLTGSVRGTPTRGLLVVRLFPGKGAVMLFGATVREPRGGALEATLRQLKKSLTLRGAAPGGRVVTSSKRRPVKHADAGPWRVAFGRDWQRQESAEGQVVLVRKPELLVAQRVRGGSVQLDLETARQPFPIDGEHLLPVGEPSADGDGIANEWASDTKTVARRSRCHDDGCFWLLASTTVDRRFVQQNLLLWFGYHAERLSSGPPSEATAKGPPARVSREQKRKAPSKKSRLARRLAGQRLHYSMTTGYGGGGVFVGGEHEREYHFCSDGGVFTASREEMVATGYESGERSSREGVWTTRTQGGREVLSIRWSDGAEDTLVPGYDPISKMEETLKNATPAQLREYERKVLPLLPAKIGLLRLGAGAPELFDMEASAVCER